MRYFIDWIFGDGGVMKVVRIETRTASGESCVGAKRIYAVGLSIKWKCPECGNENHERFNQVPLISYGHYCHCFYCDDCGYESESDEKMYKLESINEDSADLVFSENNNLKAYAEVTKLVEL